MANLLYDTAAVHEALDRMAATLAAHSDNICLLGILNGGAAVADALQQRLEASGHSVERGNLDISFYRDDLDTIGPNPEVGPSDIPFDISEKDIWLVDDVLYTGRTIRAALGDIFDYGRPATIRLAVLLDRGGRELPISADLTGLRHEAPAGISVKLIHDDEDWHIEQRRVK